MSWRYVLLFGLLPAAVAFVVRMFVKEPERWTAAAATAARRARVREIFAPGHAARARSARSSSPSIALITWWTCNAFIQVAGQRASPAPKRSRADSTPTRHRRAQAELDQTRDATASTGADCSARCSRFRSPRRSGRRTDVRHLLRVPRPRRCFATFGLDLPAETRLYMYFFIGLTVFGVFGSFTFYLPELFPTRLRSTGQRLLLQHRPRGRRPAAYSRWAPSPNAGQGRSRHHHAHAVHDRLRAAHRACCSMHWVIETRGPEDARLNHGWSARHQRCSSRPAR